MIFCLKKKRSIFTELYKFSPDKQGGAKMSEIEQKIDANRIRDEKIFSLTLLGWSKTRVANELNISRNTVSMVIGSSYGQGKLAEMYECIEQPLMMLPELVGMSLNELKNVLKGGYSVEKSKSIIDAAKLILGVAAKFKELDRDAVRTVTHIQEI